jgi:hypothetical protein
VDLGEAVRVARGLAEHPQVDPATAIDQVAGVLRAGGEAG